MTVVMIALVFAAFVATDALVRTRRAARDLAEEEERRLRARRRLARRQFSGAAPRRYFHPGHMWARPVGDGLIRVGLDAFAVRLVGAPDKVRLPAPGTVLAAGLPAFGLTSGGRHARLVAPVTGEVVAVNDAVFSWPWLVDEDPLGHGWLVELRAPDDGTDLTGLLDLIPEGPAERSWSIDERTELFERLAGSEAGLAADGGLPVRDFAEHLPDAAWRRLAHHFFRTPAGARELVEERT